MILVLLKLIVVFALMTRLVQVHGFRPFTNFQVAVRRSRRLLASISSSSSRNSHEDSEPFSRPQKQEQLRQSRYQQLQRSSTLSLAPMMDYTDRHFKHVVRLISKRTLLYSEMVAANALAFERRNNHDTNYLARFLSQGSVEPLEGASVLQLGGSNPQMLYEATRAVHEAAASSSSSSKNHNYTALNLNCGCPSPKVAGKGCFGAALMDDDPTFVAQLAQAMYEGGQGQWPVTVKCRIGTDTPLQQQQITTTSISTGEKKKDDYTVFGEQEYSRLCRFIEKVASGGIVTDFSVHARIAVLSRSFSPDENRKIPLHYHVVRRLVHDFPELRFTLNGGIESIAGVQDQLEKCPGLAGVMIGRAWAADPWSFAMADRLLYGQEIEDLPATNRLQVLQAYGRHADYEESIWDPAKIRRFIIKAISPLFTGEPNSKRYRIALDELACRAKAFAAQGKSFELEPPISELILNVALTHLSQETLLQTPQESYEQRLWQEQARGKSLYIAEWQKERKMDAEATYNLTLLNDPLSALGS